MSAEHERKKNVIGTLENNNTLIDWLHNDSIEEEPPPLLHRAFPSAIPTIILLDRILNPFIHQNRQPDYHSSNNTTTPTY